MERAHEMDTIIFDKTGTITKGGEPEVTDILTFNSIDRDELLRIVATIEKVSEHPLGQAIVRKGEEELLKITEPESFMAVPGKGLKAKLEGKQVYIGNRKLMADAGISIEQVEEELLRLEEEGKTAMITAIDGRVSGIIAVADQIKENSQKL